MIRYYKDTIGSKPRVAALLSDGSYIECYRGAVYTFFSCGNDNACNRLFDSWNEIGEAEFKAECDLALSQIVSFFDLFAKADQP